MAGSYRRVNPEDFPHFDAGLKLAWAKKHLEAFDVEVGKFLKGKTHTSWTEDDLDAGEYVLHLEPEPIPVEIGLTAGDAIACLRASLDHLACALTKTPLGTPNHKASFPIIPTDSSDGLKLLKKCVSGIPTDAIKIIKALQPYNDGDAYKFTKLWKLHRLWNIDKHRRIPLHGTAAQIPVTFPPDMPPISGGTDNSGIMRFPLAAKPYVQFNPAVKINVYLGDKSEGIFVSAGELVEIYKFVHHSVFPMFGEFFKNFKRPG